MTCFGTLSTGPTELDLAESNAGESDLRALREACLTGSQFCKIIVNRRTAVSQAGHEMMKFIPWMRCEISYPSMDQRQQEVGGPLPEFSGPSWSDDCQKCENKAGWLDTRFLTQFALKYCNMRKTYVLSFSVFINTINLTNI